MMIADVLGTVVSPVQIPLLDGRSLLLIRPLTPGGEPTGKTRIAIDTIGACVGDRVLVLDEGNGARQVLDAPGGACKTVIVGVIDYVETGGTTRYDHGARDPVAPRDGS